MHLLILISVKSRQNFCFSIYELSATAFKINAFVLGFTAVSTLGIDIKPC